MHDEHKHGLVSRGQNDFLSQCVNILVALGERYDSILVLLSIFHRRASAASVCKPVSSWDAVLQCVANGARRSKEIAKTK